MPPDFSSIPDAADLLIMSEVALSVISPGKCTGLRGIFRPTHAMLNVNATSAAPIMTRSRTIVMACGKVARTVRFTSQSLHRIEHLIATPERYRCYKRDVKMPRECLSSNRQRP
jgi:hypothetical protein